MFAVSCDTPREFFNSLLILLFVINIQEILEH